VTRNGEKGNAHSVLVGKLEEKRQLGRHRLKSEDNIKIKHKEIESEGVDWSYLAEYKVKRLPVVKKVMKFWVP